MESYNDKRVHDEVLENLTKFKEEWLLRTSGETAARQFHSLVDDLEIVVADGNDAAVKQSVTNALHAATNISCSLPNNVRRLVELIRIADDYRLRIENGVDAREAAALALGRIYPAFELGVFSIDVDACGTKAAAIFHAAGADESGVHTLASDFRGMMNAMLSALRFTAIDRHQADNHIALARSSSTSLVKDIEKMCKTPTDDLERLLGLVKEVRNAGASEPHRGGARGKFDRILFKIEQTL
jgi:hypothetical protein